MTETLYIPPIGGNRLTYIEDHGDYAVVNLPAFESGTIEIDIGKPVILAGTLNAECLVVHDPCSLALTRPYKQTRPLIGTFKALGGIVPHEKAHAWPELWVRDTFFASRGVKGLHRLRAETIQIEGDLEMVKRPSTSNPHTTHMSHLLGNKRVRVAGSTQADLIRSVGTFIGEGRVDAVSVYVTEGQVRVSGPLTATVGVTAGHHIEVQHELTAPYVVAGAMPDMGPGNINCYQLIGCRTHFGNLTERHKAAA